MAAPEPQPAASARPPPSAKIGGGSTRGGCFWPVAICKECLAALCQSFCIAFSAAHVGKVGLTVRLAMSPPVSPSNEGSGRGGGGGEGGSRGTPPPLGPRRRLPTGGPRRRPPGRGVAFWRPGGVAIWLRAPRGCSSQVGRPRCVRGAS